MSVRSTQNNEPMVAVLIREALGLHGLLTKAGFPPDDIFVLYHPDAPLRMKVQQDGKEFTIQLADVPMGKLMSAANFDKAWREAANAFNASPNDKRTELINRTTMRLMITQILAQMIMSGFTIPNRNAN